MKNQINDEMEVRKVKVTFITSPCVHRALRILAARENKTVSTFIHDTLSDFFKDEIAYFMRPEIRALLKSLRVKDI